MKVNAQELAHVLAALRRCQAETLALDWHDSIHFKDSVKPLDDDEVDRLCEAINSGGFEVVDGDPEAVMAMKRIIIVVEGGIIQDISGCPPNMEIEIRDLDTEGVEEDKLSTTPNGDEYIESVHTHEHELKEATLRAGIQTSKTEA